MANFLNMPKFRDLVSRMVLRNKTIAAIAMEPAARDVLKRILPEEIAKQQAIAKQATPLAFNIPNQIAAPNQNNAIKNSGISFNTLRQMSVNYWAARACISKRQEQIANLRWNIVPENPEGELSEADNKIITEARMRMKQIAGRVRFRAFLDRMIDDLLTLDAAALYRVKTRGGQMLRLQTIDASTIRLRVQSSGETPEPPETAYEQWIRGQKIADMTVDELIYEQMNPRTSSPYGLSPLESLILVVNGALKSEMSNNAILDEGNVPEGFLAMPETYSPEQIKQFQEYWDALTAGNLAQQRRLKMIPGGKGNGYIATKKPQDMEYQKFEEWLTIKTCALFGVSPQSIGITWDLNKATAEEQGVLSKNESVRPLATFLAEIFTDVLQHDLGYSSFEFKFMDLDVRDERTMAEVNERYMKLGVKDINEVRREQNLKPLTDKPMHYIMTAAGPVLVKDIENPAEPAATETPAEPSASGDAPKKEEKESTPLEELRRWQKKVLNDIQAGRKTFRKFYPAVLEADMVEAIERDLASCHTADEVRACFKNYSAKQTDQTVELAVELSKHLNAMIHEHPAAVQIEKHA